MSGTGLCSHELARTRSHEQPDSRTVRRHTSPSSAARRRASATLTKKISKVSLRNSSPSPPSLHLPQYPSKFYVKPLKKVIQICFLSTPPRTPETQGVRLCGVCLGWLPSCPCPCPLCSVCVPLALPLLLLLLLLLHLVRHLAQAPRRLVSPMDPRRSLGVRVCMYI